MPDSLAKTCQHGTGPEERGAEKKTLWSITPNGLRNGTTSHRETNWTVTKNTENWGSPGLNPELVL